MAAASVATLGAGALGLTAVPGAATPSAHPATNVGPAGPSATRPDGASPVNAGSAPAPPAPSTKLEKSTVEAVRAGSAVLRSAPSVGPGGDPLTGTNPGLTGTNPGGTNYATVNSTATGSKHSTGANSAAAPSPNSTRSPATGTTAATSTAAYAGSWGLYTPEFPGSLSSVAAIQSDVNRTATYVMWYVHWAGPYSALNLSDLAAVRANGSTPMITWMSDDSSGATTITDAAIASGRYDSYIRSWAQGLRSYRRPVLLRFDHEMNGNWYGWSPGVNGNTASGFVAAWRHVYGIFSSVGASNVTFVWSPNIDYTGATAMSSLYPGNSYVGMVGLDGYNWGTVDGHVWQTPQQIFGPSVAEITAVTSRPLMITEVASTSAGGDKTAWIGQFFQYLRATPAIRGFVWFDVNKETDWSIGSVAGSLNAFVAGMDG